MNRPRRLGAMTGAATSAPKPNGKPEGAFWQQFTEVQKWGPGPHWDGTAETAKAIAKEMRQQLIADVERDPGCLERDPTVAHFYKRAKEEVSTQRG